MIKIEFLQELAKGHLCLIEQIGMENYIIEMLGE